jgi:hypothetical protein
MIINGQCITNNNSPHPRQMPTKKFVDDETRHQNLAIAQVRIT